MELKDIKIFQSVIENGSINRAAESLNYVQSYITARIKSLESEFNTQLFLRHNKGTTLTSEGEKLHHYTQKITHTMDEINHVFKLAEPSVAQLNIGTVETITKLPEVLSLLRSNYPNISLAIDTDVTETIAKRVLNKSLDCAFTAGFVHEQFLNTRVLFHEKLIFVSNQPLKHLNDLIHMPMLVFKKGCNYRRKLEAWLEHEHISQPKLVEFGTLETIIGSVKSGLGISLIPESTVSNELNSGKLYSYDLPEKYSDITTNFIWRKDADQNSVINHFITTIEQFSTEINQAPTLYS